MVTSYTGGSLDASTSVTDIRSTNPGSRDECGCQGSPDGDCRQNLAHRRFPVRAGGQTWTGGADLILRTWAVGGTPRLSSSVRARSR